MVLVGSDGAGCGRPATGVYKRFEYLETLNHKGRTKSVTIKFAKLFCGELGIVSLVCTKGS
jgi:hypothetical protein